MRRADLDGDGNEATGWDMIYLHLANEGMVPQVPPSSGMRLLGIHPVKEVFQPASTFTLRANIMENQFQPPGLCPSC